jgi:hypothetical protein
MAYVVVNRQTGARHPRLPRNGGVYKTQAAAQAAITRYVKRHSPIAGEWRVMEVAAYHQQVPMVTRVNLMTGLEYQERADTPSYCSPASESYWSM